MADLNNPLTIVGTWAQPGQTTPSIEVVHEATRDFTLADFSVIISVISDTILEIVREPADGGADVLLATFDATGVKDDFIAASSVSFGVSRDFSPGDTLRVKPAGGSAGAGEITLIAFPTPSAQI
jgi:hypothetical protein